MFALAFEDRTNGTLYVCADLVSPSSQIPTAEVAVRRRPITRMRLAAGVTKCIKRFITVRF
jgi:hypothetical protein